ncbi:Ppx/GppA phosphatase family protein [Portibacter marinus]|uniref:Ppx/GppA phosphatase family protein n=1 Tax=Portibacter marinus TaxID=2898660 RepID=UPI001F34125C|nr:hypothetical protein [Portibacter marinus]
MEKYAAIDLGTNTFHLLIASFNEEGRLIEHFRRREYIHLAKDGIERISQEAYNKALTCVQQFATDLEHFEISHISCSGTAALRTASNGLSLVHEIENCLKVKVDVIDGITEAKYIYQGVKLAVPDLKEGNHLIMDIGGGSVEFIVIKSGHFVWSNSYPIGIAVLRRQFHKSEPITRDEIMMINQFIRDHIAKLLYLCRDTKFTSLIGASGSFEVLSKMASDQDEALQMDVPISSFLDFYEEIVSASLDERLSREDIPKDRAQLIVVAFQLIKYMLSQLKIDKIIVSKYAMKEGMLSNFLDASKN